MRPRNNGELFALMREHRFDVFITVDQNVPFQQNIKGSGVAVIVLHARSNRLKDLLPLAPVVLQKIRHVKPGELERAEASP